MTRPARRVPCALGPLPGRLWAALPAVAVLLLCLFTIRVQADSSGLLSFDQRSNQFMLVTNFGGSLPSNELTIEFWMKADGGSDHPMIALDTDTAGSRVSAVVPSRNGAVIFQFGDESGILSYWPPEPIAGSWQHFALVASAKGKSMRIYRNGVEEAKKTGLPSFPLTSGTLRIGGLPNAEGWGGELDEVRVWRVARSQPEISATMRVPVRARETNLVASWRFDDGEGELALDASGHGLDAVLVNAPSWRPATMPPVSGGALSFSANSPGVRVPSALWFDETFTIEAWVFQRNHSKSARLIAFGNGSDADQIIAFLSQENSGFPAFHVSRSHSASTPGAAPPVPPVPALRATQKILLSQWTHVAFSREVSGVGRIYLNGVEAGSGPLPAPRQIERSNAFIGSGPTANEGAPDAIIDEIRIWSTTRSPAEIQAFRKRTVTGTEDGLLACWRFDEGAGLKAKDTTGHGHDAVVPRGVKWSGASAPLGQSPVVRAGLVVPAGPAHATLEGAVYGNGLPTTAWFEWGPTADYGHLTPAVGLADRAPTARLNAPLDDLASGAAYHYRLVATNAAGVTRGMDRSFSLPPFALFGVVPMRTAAAGLGAFLFAGVLLFSSARYFSVRRLSGRLKELRQQQMLSQERVRIARDLHDDLGARLTKISLLTELARRDTADARLSSEHIAQIAATAKEVAQALDEIVWAVDPSNDTLDGFGSYICSVAEETCRDTQVRCRLDVPAILPEVEIHSDVRHNFVLALKETLNNTLKHSCASEVRVTLSYQAPLLRLTVEDDGHGFDPATAIRGNGLSNLHGRLEQIGGHCRLETAPAGGTRVVLSIGIQPGKSS